MFEWIDLNLILEKYTDYAYHTTYPIQKVMPLFFAQYPTPSDWLHCKEKIRFKSYNNTDETFYILCWIVEKKLWLYRELQSIILDYFLSRPLSKTFKTICLRKKLISEEQFQQIKKINPLICLSKISIVCLCLDKKLAELTPDDVLSFPSFNSSKKYTPKRMQNLLIQLGYSNTKSAVRKKRTTWTYLTTHPLYGDVFTHFEKYLTAASAKTRYLTTMGTSLKLFLDFVEHNAISDFSSFHPILFEDLINFIADKTSPATAGVYIPKIKTFFKVYLGDPLFPDTLEFCDTYWSAYTKTIKKINREKDGRAFSDSGLANNIVSILKNYIPKNEVDLLCKNFWLIIASCPIRYSYLLNLQSQNAIKPLPNTPNAYGIYSKFVDKSGNSYGQFPILDKLGVDAILTLQERATKLELQPIYNSFTKESYIHLFQLSEPPWLLDSNILSKFYNDSVIATLKTLYPEDTILRATAHSFRHYLITHVAIKTGDETICQTAAGHLDVKMTREYLRSKASRSSLLFRVMDKFEKHEITGKFYLRLVELLSSTKTPVEEMLYALTTEMELDQFLNTYGQKLTMGYCFNNKECYRWHACWSCNNFIMTRNEITQAIITLSTQILELKKLQQCTGFSHELPMVKNKFRLISLIIKRLTELDLSEAAIEKMVMNCIENKDLSTGVINDVTTC